MVHAANCLEADLWNCSSNRWESNRFSVDGKKARYRLKILLAFLRMSVDELFCAMEPLFDD